MLMAALIMQRNVLSILLTFDQHLPSVRITSRLGKSTRLKPEKLVYHKGNRMKRLVATFVVT